MPIENNNQPNKPNNEEHLKIKAPNRLSNFVKSIVFGTTMGIAGGALASTDQIEGYNGQTIDRAGVKIGAPGSFQSLGLNGADVGKPNDQIEGYNGTTTGRENGKPGAPGSFQSIGVNGADVGKPSE